MIVTPDLLDTLRSDPDLPIDTWYLVVATALCILNRPDEIPLVYAHAVGKGHGSSSPHVGLPNGSSGSSSSKQPVTDHEQRRIARRMREALLKTSAIGGLPKTINALQELKKAVPAHLADEPPPNGDSASPSPSPSPTRRREDVYETPTSDVLARGRAFFDQCYGKVASRVMASLDHSGTEDLGLAVRVAYGYVLSTTAILDEAETSFTMIAALIPLDVNPQLKGHLRGALNGGASVEQVRAVRQLTIHMCEAAGMRVLTGEHAAAASGWGWRAEVENL